MIAHSHQRLAGVVAGICVLTVAAAIPALATPLLGLSFNGQLYDVNIATGAATSPRGTPIQFSVGITFGPNGILYGLTTLGSTPRNSLISFDPVTGASSTVGETGLDSIVEGDLDFDPTTGILYGLQDAPNAPDPPRLLFTMNPSTGNATVIGDVGGAGDLSAMSFDASGNLFVLNITSDQLLTVNKSTGAIINSVDLSIDLGTTAGMDFDPMSGDLYVADGGTFGTNGLYSLDPVSGVLTLIGPTGLPSGLLGLAFVIPEPSSIAIGMLAAIGFVAPWRRRRLA